MEIMARYLRTWDFVVSRFSKHLSTGFTAPKLLPHTPGGFLCILTGAVADKSTLLVAWKAEQDSVSLTDHLFRTLRCPTPYWHEGCPRHAQYTFFVGSGLCQSFFYATWANSLTSTNSVFSMLHALFVPKSESCKRPKATPKFKFLIDFLVYHFLKSWIFRNSEQVFIINWKIFQNSEYDVCLNQSISLLNFRKLYNLRLSDNCDQFPKFLIKIFFQKNVI